MEMGMIRPKQREEDMSEGNPGFSTLAVHAGAQPDPTTKARITPIYQTTSFVFDNADHAAALFGLQQFGNIYTRIMNPTQAVLEERVAALEGGTTALATASGHAAQLLVFHTIMRPGDNFIAARQLYGGSINQFGHAFKNFDWQVRWMDSADPASMEALIDDKTKAVFIESLANPGGTFVDIAAIADIAHRHGLPLIVDNTMASPYLVRPLEHGADIIVHSLTKFMGGHGNSMGGVLVDGGTFDWSKSGKYPMLSEPRPEYGGIVLHQTFGNIAFAIAARVLGLRDFGPALAPMNAFLLLTGIETLPLRMQRHCDSALAVAKWLKTHPKVSWVNYAGLEDNPNHALQRRYSPKGAGAVFTFGLKGGYESGKTFVESLKLFSHLANIGDTRSLVIHPASTTHRQLTPEQQVAAGAGPDVVRLSVGIEDVSDIVADLEQALERA
jgi:O-acetylhomoserine (thiol)-lyase